MHQPVEKDRPKIKFVRMITGEDVLTEYVVKNLNYGNNSGQFKDFIYFQNPLKVIYGLTPKQDGMIISLAQWVFDTICEEQMFSIRDSDILIIAEPTKEMTEYYWEAIDKNAGKKRKIQSVSQKDLQEDEFEEISEEEIEMIRTALETAKDFKRKLH
jgi:hypothetical protein